MQNHVLIVSLQVFISVIAGWYVLTDLLQPGARIDVNIGGPIVLVLLVLQVVLGLYLLRVTLNSQKKN